MSTSHSIIAEFFEGYERSRNTFDVDVIGRQYPDAFMFAGPNGVRVTEKSTVVAGLLKGQQLLKTLGHTTTKLVSLDETTLDEHYAMARAQFVWRFSKGSEPVDVDVQSTFILFIQDGVARIVFQQEHEDFQLLLRERGLLPPKPPLPPTGGGK